MDCFAALAMTEGERRHETALPRHRPPTGRASARPMTGAVKQSIAPAVIASEAKQSIAPRKERMDCFAALAMTWRRLAMTGSSRHAFTTSPRFAPNRWLAVTGRAALLQRRVRRGQHDGRVHLFQESRSFAEKRLPFRIFHRIAARLSAGVQVGIGPDVAGLVGLAGLGLPEAH